MTQRFIVGADPEPVKEALARLHALVAPEDRAAVTDAVWDLLMSVLKGVRL